MLQRIYTHSFFFSYVLFGTAAFRLFLNFGLPPTPLPVMFSSAFLFFQCLSLNSFAVLHNFVKPGGYCSFIRVISLKPTVFLHPITLLLLALPYATDMSFRCSCKSQLYCCFSFCSRLVSAFRRCDSFDAAQRSGFSFQFRL